MLLLRKGLIEMKFDHIGIFVKSLDEGYTYFQKLVSIVSVSEVFNDPFLKVSVRFLYDDSGICYEIVAPNGEGNPVDSVLKAKRNILNHLAYRVSNFDAAIMRLRENKCIPLGPAHPAVAFSGSRVMFFLTPLRMIIEIIESEQ